MNCWNSFGLISPRPLKRVISGLPLWSKNKLGLFDTEHFVRAYALNSNSNASVGNLDLLGGSGGDLVCYNRVPVSQSMGNEVKVCDLQESADSGWFIVLAAGPTTDLCQGRKDGGVRFQKKAITATCGPSCQFIRAGLNFVADFLVWCNSAGFTMVHLC